MSAADPFRPPKQVPNINLRQQYSAAPPRRCFHTRDEQGPGSGHAICPDNERFLHANNFLAPSPSSSSSPFTLTTLAGRFAPAVVNPSELRERAGARVRVVTPAGLRVGLAKRVFAREPLLPSDVEAEEEQQVGVE